MVSEDLVDFCLIDLLNKNTTKDSHLAALSDNKLVLISQLVHSGLKNLFIVPCLQSDLDH